MKIALENIGKLWGGYHLFMISNRVDIRVDATDRVVRERIGGTHHSGDADFNSGIFVPSSMNKVMIDYKDMYDDSST